MSILVHWECQDCGWVGFFEDSNNGFCPLCGERIYQDESEN